MPYGDDPTEPPKVTRDQIAAFWKSKGAPDHVAAGIADRVVGVESGGKPTVVNKDSGATGLYQDLGERKSKLQALPHWQSPDVQNQFAYSEVTGGDKQATEGWEKIKAAKTREEASKLWDQYFERSGTTGGYGKDPVIGSGKWKVADSAIAYEQGRKNSNVVWMSPDDYLGFVPPLEADAGNRTKRRSLMKSLGLGDDIEAIPTLDVKAEKGRAKVYDQDGRNRAMVAKEEGVDLIPVAIHGGVGDLKEIEGMTGTVKPLDFKPVAAVKVGDSGLDPSGGASSRFYSGVRSGLENIGQTIQHTIPTLGAGAVAGQGRLDQYIADRQKALEAQGATKWPYQAGEAAAQTAAAAAVPFGGGLPERMALGAAGGMAAAAGEPVSDPSRFWSEKLPQEAFGAVAGAVGVPVGEAVARGVSRLPDVARWALGREPSVGAQTDQFINSLRSLTQSENRARDVLGQRFAEDEAAGGPSAAEAMQRMEQARGEGLPMTLADVGGENVQAVVGSAGRAGGPARGRLARWAVGRLGDVERDSPLMTNVEQGIEKYLATGSARTEARTLAEQRAAGAPLWQKAMDGGNLNPVERQLALDYGEVDRTLEQAGAQLGKERERLGEMEAAAAQQGTKIPKAPTRLNSFLVRHGGLKDESGEINTIIGGTKGRPALINNATGMSLDDAALRAWEEGYLGTLGRPEINDLLDAVAQDHNMVPVFSSRDEDAVRAYEKALREDEARSKRPLPQGQKRVSPAQLQFQRDKVGDLQARAAKARDDKKEIGEVIQRGQEDGTLGLRNAIYSPELGRLIKNPRVVRGLNRGMIIERDIADAEMKPFRPKDYAVTGTDKEGNPIVGAIPNMRLVAVAKEGLDAMLEGDALRDSLTGRVNKEGRAVKMLRDRLLGETDKLNPDYKIARDKWAGDSALIAAVRDGKAFHTMSPEEIGEWFTKASESEKQAFRVGAADRLKEDISRAAFGGDPTKRVINQALVRRQLQPMFRSPEDADAFLQRINAARTMAQTPQSLLRGSPTAARVAEDMANRGGLGATTEALHALVSGLHGHPGGAARMIGRAFMNTPDAQAVNDAIVRLALDPSLRLETSPGVNLLRSLPLPRTQNALRQGLAGRVAGPLAVGMSNNQVGQ